MDEFVRAVSSWPAWTVVSVQIALMFAIFVAIAISHWVVLSRSRTPGSYRAWRIVAGAVFVASCILGVGSVLLGGSMLWYHGLGPSTSGFKVAGVGIGFFVVGWSAWRWDDNFDRSIPGEG